MPAMKSRNWCFTLNNPTDGEVDHIDDVDREKVRYVVYGNEVGENGTPHLQGFIVFKNACRLRSVKDSVGSRAHVEIAKGTVKQNYDYCTKDGRFYEIGDRPKFDEEKGEREKKRYKRAWDLARQGDIGTMVNEMPDIAVRHYSTMKRIRDDALFERKLNHLEPNTLMEWYYGPSRTGKSYVARKENPNAYLKDCNKWWDGYADQETVIVEDVDPTSRLWMCRLLKVWTDIYTFNAEKKHGNTGMIRPKKVVITSNYHPRDIWEDERELIPIMKRFRVTHFPSLGERIAEPLPDLPPLPDHMHLGEDEEEDDEVLDLIDLTQE